MPAFRLRVRTTEIDLPVGELTVGRGTDCFLRIDDDLVSRRHARMVVTDKKVMFEDLGSRNGSKVNGQRQVGTVELQIGDTFEIGSQVFQLIIGGAALREATMTMMPHRACRKCELLIDARLEVCPHCGATQRQTQLMEQVEGAAEVPTAMIPAYPGHSAHSVTSAPSLPVISVPSNSVTGPASLGGGSGSDDATRAFASSFALMTGLADKLLTLGRIEEAERMLSPRLREALSRSDTAEALDPKLAGDALARAVKLATLTGKDEWYSWVFRFAHNTQRRLDDRTLDELHARMLVHKPAAAGPLMGYFAAQQGEDEATTQFKKRLEALLRFCRD